MQQVTAIKTVQHKATATGSKAACHCKSLPAVPAWQRKKDSASPDVIQAYKQPAADDDCGCARQQTRFTPPGSHAAAPAQRAPMQDKGPAQLQPFRTPAAAPQTPVAQLYKPTSKDIEEGKVFFIRRKANGDLFQAKVVGYDNRYGWYFEEIKEDDEDMEAVKKKKKKKKERILIASDRNIFTKSKDAEKKEGHKTHSYYDELLFSQKCQFPGCKEEEFEQKADLHEHIMTTHPFPKHEWYPYGLWGSQNALTHTLHKEGEKYKAINLETGDKFHSEWRAGKELFSVKEKKEIVEDKKRNREEINDKKVTKKKKQDKKEAKQDDEVMHEHKPEEGSKYTLNMNDLMDKKNENPPGLFVTGEPHCGICSSTVPHSGLPLGFPTRAKPITSKQYSIPFNAPNQKEIFSEFGSAPEKKKEEERSEFTPGQFPESLQTWQQYNKELSEEHAKEGGKQYVQHMMQSMIVNRDSYVKFFGNIDNKSLTRDELKEEMANNPVPVEPTSFMWYCPSPLRNKEEEDKKAKEYEEKRRKIMEHNLKVALARINKRFEKVDVKKQKFRKSDKQFFNPLLENNCLITSMNGGKEATVDDVTMIRYHIFEELGIAYGKYLPASPEAMYIIAKVLKLKNVVVKIFLNEDDEPSQVFLITGDMNIIEKQGDEEDLDEEGMAQLHIDHNGSNHFKFRKK